MYARNPFASTQSAGPAPSLLSAAFSPGSASGTSSLYGMGPDRWAASAGRSTFGAPLSTSISDPAAFATERQQPPSIVIRRLPQNISAEALGAMLIFAGDLMDTDIISSPYKEDRGFATAVARFKTHAGALEAQSKLNGKPNAAKEANMIVEIHSGSMVAGVTFDRRSASDASVPRTQTSSANSAASAAATAGAAPGRSRFNSTFQSAEKTSPPLPTPTSSGGSASSNAGPSGSSAELPVPESNSHLQTLFSPQSPVANGIGDARRVSGKSMINDDTGDDETGELLKDPVGFARSGQQGRRPTNPHIPVSRFGNLSLCTDANGGAPAPASVAAPLRSPTAGSIASPRSNHHPMQSPTSPNGPGMVPNGGTTIYSQSNFPRTQFPPINPADQNPPCNTLYVGNLPIDTSEDELKAIFSKQRGYRRLCFRTKQNGPMCFVEFEDISFATKALNELYGHPLHNSVKGGIRLSFSKNPLGVRSGQPPNGLGSLSGQTHHPPMNPHAMLGAHYGHATAPNGAPGMLPPTTMAHVAGGSTATFGAVSGPPPGLATPPGLMNPSYNRGGNAANGLNGTNGPIGGSALNMPNGSSAGMGMQPNGIAMDASGFVGGYPFMVQQGHDYAAQQQHQQRLGGQHGSRQPPTLSGGIPPSMNGSFGREGRFGDFNNPGR